MPANIYLFYGPDSYSLLQEVTRWREVFEQKHGRQNYFELNCLTDTGPDTPSQLKSALSGQTLFGTTKLVILSEALSSKNAVLNELILKTLPTVSSKTFVVFKESKAEAKNPLHQLLVELSKSGQATLREFASISEQEFKQWLAQQLRQRAVDFDPAIVGELTARLTEAGATFGSHKTPDNIDLWRARNYVDILIAYSLGRRLEIQDVKDMVPLPDEAHMFDLLDGILLQDEFKTLIQLQNLVTSERSSVLPVISFLISQLREYCRLKSLMDQHVSESSLVSQMGWTKGRVWMVSKKIQRPTLDKMIALTTQLILLEKDAKLSPTDPFTLLSRLTLNWSK